jgi:hypothetical protein
MDYGKISFACKEFRPLWLGLSVMAIVAVLCLTLGVQQAEADNLYARIQGVITDPAGGALVGAKLTATNTGTNISYTTESKTDGNYVFLNLPIGTYNVTATTSGFRTFTAAGITLVLDQVYALNIKMELGKISEQVTVEATNVQVETANTQLGTVINGDTIINMPLITRNWLQLQQFEPGVMSSSDRFGTYSTNGAQSQQNSFLIDGQDSNDLPLNTALIRPSPDAIGEFDMVTNTINAEYGRNSGAIMNATIKSGTNVFHGDVFEFYRDTFLNAADFYSHKPPVYHQNEFGGTIGGPIIKDHTFFFFSYQGQRFRQPQNSSQQTVYSQAERNGDFSQGADVDPTTGIPYIAESTTVSPLALYGDSASPCPVSGGVRCAANSTTFAKLFSTGVVPTQDLDPIATKLVSQFVPLPNVANNGYAFNAVTPGTDNQYLFKIDQTFNSKDSMKFYALFESMPTQDTLPFTGATLPGFPEESQRSYKQFSAGWTHVFNPNILNELRLGYTRFNYKTVQPVTVIQPSTYGFNIKPNITSGASLPYMSVVGTGAGQVNFAIGFSYNGPQPRIDQTYQIDDNFSWALGRHTLKFGYAGRKFEVQNPFGYVNNGYYTFAAGGPFTTGNAGADFLMGIPDSYNQSSGNVINDSAYGHYLYAQDSWKARANLTLNYGLGWQINTPLTDHGPLNNNQAITCFRPGQQSTVYPTAPENLVFPGDAGCSASGYYTGYKHFGPRVGFAWSPEGSGGAWRDLTGRQGQFSIRGGFGIYYNQIEEELSLQNLLSPPFGLYDYGVGDVGLAPGFADPWTDIAGRGAIPNKYPYTAPKPGSAVDFTFFAPISTNVIDPKFAVPYSMNYNLTMQRELPGQMILTIAYVGLQGRHLERAFDVNEAKLGACAAIPACIGSTGARYLQGYTYPQNFPYPEVIPGTSILYIGGIGQQSSDGNSHYNSLQVSVNKRLSHGLTFLASYTYAHSQDDGSSYESSSGQQTGTRGINPFNNVLNWGDSQYDARNRFVVNFTYEIPVPHALSNGAVMSRVFKGWQLSGSTTFQTGFPVTLYDSSFRSGTCWAYTYYGCADNPNQVGSVVKQDPRATSKHLYFNTSAFKKATVGTFGNTGRDTLHGPGQNFTNLGVYKNISLTERMKLQLRLESQNTFNHVNFNLPSSNINSSLFGRVTGDTLGPRLVQLAAKFNF